MIKFIAAMCAGLALISSLAHAADPAPATPAAPSSAAVRVERISIDSPALAGNLEGNSARRDVFVVLPPSYASSPERRYPVVYALHGYGITAEKWFAMDKPDQIAARAFGSGVREMIWVFPDTYTRHHGSMYSTSATTGDWEAFITRDLVGYVDAHYRTIANRASRGLMGHSMGGYGTVRIGMKYPGTFSSLYAMSACCLAAREITPEQGKELEAVRTMEQASAGSFMVRTTLTAAAAWSPNPNKPPFYVDLPYEGGQLRPRVLAEWAANAPLAMLPQYVNHLRQYQAIALDVGNRDSLIDDNKALHEALNRFGIAHTFEVYDGDHGSGVVSRLETKVLPYFSRHLQF
jgi:enterochelin esterase-like enzyme